MKNNYLPSDVNYATYALDHTYTRKDGPIELEVELGSWIEKLDGKNNNITAYIKYLLSCGNSFDEFKNKFWEDLKKQKEEGCTEYVDINEKYLEQANNTLRVYFEQIPLVKKVVLDFLKEGKMSPVMTLSGLHNYIIDNKNTKYWPGFIDPQDLSVLYYFDQIMTPISNSNFSDLKINLARCPDLLDLINAYSPRFGTNPLILACLKGYNHTDSDRDLWDSPGRQKDIIDKLLSIPKVDVNLPHLNNGMTPLHIVCMRGDSPELITKLIARGADVNIKDLNGKKPFEYLDMPYDEMKKVMEKLTCHEFAGENKSYVATLPTQQRRISNVRAIKQLECFKERQKNKNFPMRNHCPIM